MPGPFDPRLFPLLAHAMRLPADEVAPFLERECRGDVALATRVEELLRDRATRVHLPGAGRSPLLERLQRALRVPELLGSATDLHRVRELLAGLRRRPGEPERYEIREEIGRGGMG